MSAHDTGPVGARLCFIGEAPSYSEIAADKPFVGPAGQVFDQCLQHAGIIRASTRILNLFPFLVKKDKDDNIYDREGNLLYNNKKGELTSAAQPHVAALLDKISSSSHRVVLPLGGPALAALHPDRRGITKWRGSPLTIKELGNQRLVSIPSIHPAASLRGQFIWRYLIKSDFSKALRFSKVADPRKLIPQRNCILRSTLKQILDYIAMVKDQKFHAMDTEIFNHQVSCLSLAPHPMESISIAFTDGWRHIWSEADEAMIWLALADLYADPSQTAVFQNSGFDTTFLIGQNNILFKCKIEDTMVAHHILYPDFQKKLELLTSLHTDEPYYKEDKKLWNKLGSSVEELERFWIYNCKDSSTDLEVWLSIKPELEEEPGYYQPYKQTMALLPVLQYMMIRGMRVDQDGLAITRKDIADKLAAKQAELESIAPGLNANSPKQCSAYFYDKKGIKPYISAKTGRATTDDIAMQRIWKRYRLREAKLVQDVRGLGKLKSTYLEVEIDSDSRIRTSYNMRGTRHMRLSSSQTVFGTGMNMQNLDPEFKGFIVADEG